MISWTCKEMAALALRGFAINEILRRHTVHYRCERVAKDSRDLHWLERFPRVLFSVGFFFSGWLALFRWLGINTLHYFGERHWNAYLIALLTMMAVIIVWLNPRCFLSLLFFSEKKNEVHIESQKGAGLYLIILLSRHLNGCALFFVNVKEE